MNLRINEAVKVKLTQSETCSAHLLSVASFTSQRDRKHELGTRLQHGVAFVHVTVFERPVLNGAPSA